MRARSEEPMQIPQLARGADMHQHWAVIAHICEIKSSKCQKGKCAGVLSIGTGLLWVQNCSEGKGLSSLSLGVQVGEQEQQRVRMGRVTVQGMHPASPPASIPPVVWGSPRQAANKMKSF